MYPDSVDALALDEEAQALADLGILEKEKQGRKTVYRLTQDHISPDGLEKTNDAYSEALPGPSARQGKLLFWGQGL